MAFLKERWANDRWLVLGAGAGAVLLIVLILVLALGGGDGEGGGEGGPGGVDASPPVLKALEGMSLSQKADSVVISGFQGTDEAVQLAASGIGGVMVGPEDWFGVGKGKALNAQIAAAGGKGIAPLIVARQEGGAFRPYPDLPPAESQADIAASNDPTRATAWAADTADALGNAGFDLNLAPIADVATLGSPVSDRAFSDDPEQVTVLTRAAVKGCRDKEATCGTPYFPGLGAASGDPSTGPATVSLDVGSMEGRDLAPFRAAIAERVPAVVVSLALYAAYDPVTPAALSSAVIGGVLRDELNYKGLAISDDLSVGVAATGVPPPQAAVQAIAAGSDMAILTVPAEAAAARKKILEAAKKGEIPAERLDQAAARVLQLKQRLGLL